MFKIRKILSLSILIVVPAMGLFFATSCSTPNPKGDYSSEHADFINERTFSLMSYDEKNITWGTAWIFQKSSTNNLNFSYYIATNVHVASSFSRSIPVHMYLGYNEDYTKSKFIPTNEASDITQNYYPVDDRKWQLLGETSDTRPTKPEWNVTKDGTSYEADIDFDVFRVDFGTTEEITRKDPTHDGHLLERLNKLNEYANSHAGKVIEFAQSDYSYNHNMTIHTAGFPYKTHGNSSGPQWISYETKLQSGYFDSTPHQPLIPISSQPENQIKFKDGKPIAIFGKAILYTRGSTPEFTGGSSGSMIVDDNDVAIGINFAGLYEDETQPKSIQGYGLFLNTKDPRFKDNYQYEVFNDWFNGLT